MSGDNETLKFYDAEAGKYAEWSPPPHPYPYLEKFLANAPTGRVLDFGCGSGWAAARMQDAGRDVDALDGSADLAAEAKRIYGLDVTVARFDEFDTQATYAAIWAHFSLLHDVKANMPSNLKNLHDALTAKGLLYLGLKAGEGERRDSLGRFYAYYEMQELSDLLSNAGFTNIDMRERTGMAYDGDKERLWHIFAHKGAV